MKHIYKYEVIAGGLGDILVVSRVLIPSDHKIIAAAIQKDHKMVVWAEVDTSSEEISKNIYLFQTGDKLPKKKMSYISTVINQASGIVWHIYEDYPSV